MSRSRKNILSLPLLFQITHELAGQGKRIGLTHGAFDLFHITHLDLFLKSANLCDFLVVGVESDENIQQYKSSGRPIIDQESRMKLVSQTDCVDACFIIDEYPRPELYIDIYKELHIEFITIGRYFHSEERVLYQTKKANIELIHLYPDERYSTTMIIDKIKKANPEEKKVPYSQH